MTSFAAVATALVSDHLFASPSLRAVHRFDYAADKWVRCRMYELKAGDVFWLEEVGVLLAHGNPEMTDGVWSVNAVMQIDPATNQWQPIAPESIS